MNKQAGQRWEEYSEYEILAANEEKYNKERFGNRPPFTGLPLSTSLSRCFMN